MDVLLDQCPNTDVVLVQPPCDVIVLAGAAPASFQPGERTIAFGDPNFGLIQKLRQEDNYGSILADATLGPLTGVNAIIMDETLLASPMLVMFKKVDNTNNEVDVLDHAGNKVLILSIPNEKPAGLTLQGGKVSAL